MVFNSQYNSLNDTIDNEASIEVLRQNYNIASDGYTKIIAPELYYKPTNRINQEFIKAGRTGQQPYLNADELAQANGMDEEMLEGAGIGKFFKKVGRSVKKVVTKLDSRWVTILKTYPMCVMHERGIYVLQKSVKK